MIWSARRRLQVDEEPEPRALLHRQGSGRRPLQDAIDVDRGPPEREEDVCGSYATSAPASAIRVYGATIGSRLRDANEARRRAVLSAPYTPTAYSIHLTEPCHP
jgi:hypothetical protein